MEHRCSVCRKSDEELRGVKNEGRPLWLYCKTCFELKASRAYLQWEHASPLSQHLANEREWQRWLPS